MQNKKNLVVSSLQLKLFSAHQTAKVHDMHIYLQRCNH